MGKGEETPAVSPANNGDKKPLTAGDEEEGDKKEVTGDPVPENIQAWICLIAVVGGVFLIQGIFSSEWVYSMNGFYWQGLFLYCIGTNFNATGDVSGEMLSSEEIDLGCYQIGLENQGYTLGVAFLCAVSLSANIFSTTLVVLGLWVRDLDSKIKSFRLAFYLMVISFVTLTLGLIVYRVCFADVISDGELGPLKYVKEEVEESESSSSESESDESGESGWDWEFGWSYNISCAATIMILVAGGLIGYALCIMPVPEEEEEEAAE